jgi:hypothetical protein
MLLILGWVVFSVGVVLAGNFLGSGDFVIKHVTSRPLGSLAPGYAASRIGFRVYAGVLAQIGLVIEGVGIAELAPPIAGAIVVAVGVIGFVVLSALAIGGEVRTYRALKRQR